MNRFSQVGDYANGQDYLEIDLSHARRVLVCGDVHGCFDLLAAALAYAGFDGSAGDYLICTGDWLDRGPDVLRIRDFLVANPTVLWVRGNHEDILAQALFSSGARTREASRNVLLSIGGGWILDHLDADGNVSKDIRAFALMLNDAPVACRIRTPGSHYIGVVHADVPEDSWDALADELTNFPVWRHDVVQECLWRRTRAEWAISALEDGEWLDLSIPGIDHVFLGHTIVDGSPMTNGNCTWIDTGAFFTGTLAVLDVDDWIASIRT